jgi:hypothetical protein
MTCPIFFQHQGWVNMWQQRQLKGAAVDQGNWTILNDGQTVKRFLTDWFYSIDSHQEQAKNSPQNTNNNLYWADVWVCYTPLHKATAL